MKLILLISTLFLTSCALVPFSASTSGRSYGKAKFRTEFGNTNSSYHMKMGLGLTENFDTGFVMEFGAMSSSAIFLKYSLLNNETGASFATEFGYGAAGDTKFYYTGVIGSLAFSKEFELFINPRLNIVSADEADVEKGEAIGNIVPQELDLTYVQVSYGMNIWFSESAGMTLYSVWFKGDDIETTSSNTFGASLLLNF